MTNEEIKHLIKKHEGFRDCVYTDSVGVATIGYGHALHNGSRLPKAILEAIFDWDYQNAVLDTMSLVDQNGIDLAPGYNRFRRAALINMVFNMGKVRVSRFKKMLAAMKADDWDRAAEEALDSKWARQVGHRAHELAEMIRKGE